MRTYCNILFVIHCAIFNGRGTNSAGEMIESYSFFSPGKNWQIFWKPVCKFEIFFRNLFWCFFKIVPPLLKVFGFTCTAC